MVLLRQEKIPHDVGAVKDFLTVAMHEPMRGDPAEFESNRRSFISIHGPLIPQYWSAVSEAVGEGSPMHPIIFTDAAINAALVAASGLQQQKQRQRDLWQVI